MEHLSSICIPSSGQVCQASFMPVSPLACLLTVIYYIHKEPKIRPGQTHHLSHLSLAPHHHRPTIRALLPPGHTLSYQIRLIP